jgi:hypothetical protein
MERHPSQNLLSHLQVPLTELPYSDVLFPKPSSHYLSQFPVKGPLSKFPNGNTTETRVHRTFYIPTP